MMHTATRVEYNARLMGVELAPSGQLTRQRRPLAKPTRRRASKPTFVSQRVRKYRDKNSVHMLLSVMEIDQGKFYVQAFTGSIFRLLCSIFASLRLRLSPLLRQRDMPVSANRVEVSRGVGFAQIREYALTQQSGDPTALAQIGQQFRVMRNSLGLSRRDAALRLGCTEEQILVLENGYGNLTASYDLLHKLERLQNFPHDAMV